MPHTIHYSVSDNRVDIALDDGGTGSLWWAIGFHMAWDWAQSFFYGTSDSGMVAQGHFLNEHPVGPLLWSGGPTGPEGSLYIVPLLLIMALAMWLWWRRGVTAPYSQDA